MQRLIYLTAYTSGASLLLRDENPVYKILKVGWSLPYCV